MPYDYGTIELTDAGRAYTRSAWTVDGGDEFTLSNFILTHIDQNSGKISFDGLNKEWKKLQLKRKPRLESQLNTLYHQHLINLSNEPHNIPVLIKILRIEGRHDIKGVESQHLRNVVEEKDWEKLGKTFTSYKEKEKIFDSFLIVKYLSENRKLRRRDMEIAYDAVSFQYSKELRKDFELLEELKRVVTKRGRETKEFETDWRDVGTKENRKSALEFVLNNIIQTRNYWLSEDNRHRKYDEFRKFEKMGIIEENRDETIHITTYSYDGSENKIRNKYVLTEKGINLLS